MDLKFRFIPDVSASVPSTLNFKDYGSPKLFLDSLKVAESNLGKFKYLSGKIYFKPGFYSKYKDGTEQKVFNNPRWWKTGATRCPQGCCTQVPRGLTEDEARMEATEPAQIVPKVREKNWQEFKRIISFGGLEEQLNEIVDKKQIDKIVIIGRGYFQVI